MALERRCGVVLSVVDASAEASVETIAKLIGGRILPEQFATKGRSDELVERLARRHGVDVEDEDIVVRCKSPLSATPA